MATSQRFKEPEASEKAKAPRAVKEVIRNGNGWNIPELGDTVIIHYVGMLPNGEKCVLCNHYFYSISS